MNAKSFLVSGIAGGIADFLLGWLLYGMLFRDYFGGPDPDMMLTGLGCLMFGMLISYVFVRWANLVTFSSGLMAGAVIGFIVEVMGNSFYYSMQNPVDYKKFAIDVLIVTVMGAIVGGIVAAVNGAISKPQT
ncbi:MAG: hypothetical protein EOO51_00610 [Flavobacterium sp.]|nr:MAG: hypothetical protein EOO51_00610 [Flavobacterium sp.]